MARKKKVPASKWMKSARSWLNFVEGPTLDIMLAMYHRVAPNPKNEISVTGERKQNQSPLLAMPHSPHYSPG